MVCPDLRDLQTSVESEGADEIGSGLSARGKSGDSGRCADISYPMED